MLYVESGVDETVILPFVLLNEVMNFYKFI